MVEYQYSPVTFQPRSRLWRLLRHAPTRLRSERGWTSSAAFVISIFQERVTAFREANTEAQQKHAAIAIALSRLPPFHAAALKLLNVSVESNTAIADFEAVFKSDPALAADLLLVANSAEFGCPHRIDSIRHAIAFLGLERVRSLGCTIAFSYYVRNLPRNPYNRSVWAHGLATAVISDALCRKGKAPTAYTAGLMHDLGRLALSASMGQDYMEQMSREFGDIAEANAWEKSQFGTTHCAAGVVIAKNWGFPEGLRKGMGNHHGPPRGRYDSPENLVRLSCRIAQALDFPEVPLSEAVTVSLPTELSHPEIDLERLREEVQRQLQTLAL